MAGVPAHCDNCGLDFVNNAIHISNAQNVFLRNNHTNCPRCGRMARLVDGRFNERGRGLEINSAPRRTHEIFQRLQTIAERARSGEISPQEAFRQAEEVAPPALLRMLNLFKGQELSAVGILLALIALYLQVADMYSTDEYQAKDAEFQQQQIERQATQNELTNLSLEQEAEFQKRALELFQELSTKKRENIENRQGVDHKGAAPAKPKATTKAITKAITKAVVPKQKSKRRKEVRKAQKKQLVQHRQDSGRKYRSADKEKHNAKGK